MYGLLRAEVQQYSPVLYNILQQKHQEVSKSVFVTPPTPPPQLLSYSLLMKLHQHW